MTIGLICFIQCRLSIRYIRQILGVYFSGGNELPMASCLQYTDGGWKEYTSYTHKKKIYHVSWLRPDGGVQLIGGWVAGRQEEHDPTVIVEGSSSKPGFRTKHHTQ